MKNVFCILIILICMGEIRTQNLILNSSFSEVNEKRNKLLPFKILPGMLSDVKNWYLPTYINYNLYKKALGSNLNEIIYFYSSRDKYLIPKNRGYYYNTQTNADQLFENNLGFISIYLDRKYSLPFFQQKLQKALKPGNYCFKFKYKFKRHSSSYHRPISIEFAFSDNDLKKYYNKTLMVPEHFIKVDFKDTINDMDENEPWIQQCYKFSLNGNEQFLTIGTLTNKDKYSWGHFFIDDIELYYLQDTMLCDCEIIKKDLTTLFNKEYPLNKLIESDSMIMFTPPFNVGSGIISPESKEYLRSIISFMQRNPSIKIKFIEYSHFGPNTRPTHYIHFYRYLSFFGISKERISVENGLCIDETGFYCGAKSEFVKIGFMFYKE